MSLSVIPGTSSACGSSHLRSLRLLLLDRLERFQNGEQPAILVGQPHPPAPGEHVLFTLTPGGHASFRGAICDEPSGRLEFALVQSLNGLDSPGTISTCQIAGSTSPIVLLPSARATRQPCRARHS